MMVLLIIIFLLGIGISLHTDYENIVRKMWKVRDTNQQNRLLKNAELKKNISTILLVLVLVMTIYQLMIL